MPDFDKDLNPIIKTDGPSPFQLDVAAPKKAGRQPLVPASTPNLSENGDIFAKLQQASHSSGFGEKGVFVSNSTLDANRRYRTYNPTIADQEDFVAYGQSEWDKAANGVLKGANLAATTIAGGFGMLYGTLKSTHTGRFADIWDNDVMRTLDEWNEKVDNEYLPNYYSNKEAESNWYSTDNWLTTNFLFDKLIKNSGFAVGAMVSGNIANSFLRGAGALLGEATSATSIAAESSQAFKLFTPLLKNTARAFSAGKNIEAAQALESQLTSIADLTTKSGELAKIANQTNNLFKIGDMGRSTAIAVYSSAGEATFEALQTAKEYKNNLIAQFVKDNGFEPTGDDLKKIEQFSESVGKTAFFGNMALLSATEYVQLPYLLGSSYRNTRQADNNYIRGNDDILLKEGNYLAKTSPRIASKASLLKYVFDPKEAAQELGQYALQVGTQNYYNKAYLSQDADAWVDGFVYGFVGTDSRGNNVGALNSKEGIESLILGGITGGLMQARSRFQESRATARNTQEFLTLLNGSPTFKQAFQDRLKSVNRGVVLQQEYEAAVKQGDRLEATDAKTDMTYNYVSNRVRYGRFDMIMQDLADLKQESMSDVGLANLKQQGIGAINDTTEVFQGRLLEFENFAKDVNTLHESLNLRYSGNPNYSPEVIDKMVYAATKIADYDKRILALKGNLGLRGVNVTDVISSVIEGGEVRYKEAEAYINKMDAIDKDELKQELRDLKELSIRRDKFMAEFNAIKKSPKNYQDSETKLKEASEEQLAEIEGIKNDFKEGRNYTTGTEFQKASVHKLSDDEYQVKLGNVVVDNYGSEEEAEAERDNLNTYYSGLSKVRIVKINEDGSAKVESPTGEIFSLSPKELRFYDLLETPEEKTARLEIENLNESKAVKEQLANTLTKDVEINTEVQFQPEKKKDNNAVINGTVAIDDGKPHQKRANVFGINFNKFPDAKRDSIKALEVTNKTQDKAGIPGLIQYLISGTEIDPNTVVAVIMVKDLNNGKFSFVDENGEPITNDLINTAIYQVRPTEKLEMNFSTTPGKPDMQTMFRDTTPKETEKELRDRYAAQRKATLASNQLPILKPITASFGIPVFEQKSDSKGNLVNDYDAVNSVEDAELVSPKELETTHLLRVATNNTTINNGSVTFNTPLGRVFLSVPGGLVKLNNNKIGKEKANTIFSVIHQVAKNINENPKQGAINSKPLFDWLRSVVYWGIPKNKQGFSSVWFADDDLGITRLYIGTVDFVFTPSEISKNKDEIVAALQDLYHNTEASRVNSDKPLSEYSEITGIDKEGKPVTKRWSNYQTYLLSKEGRKAEEIPLTTNFKAIKGTDQTNRKAIYFVLNNNIDAEVQPTAQPKPVVQPKPQGTFVLDSKTINTYVSPAGKKIMFVGTNLEDIKVVKGGDLVEVLADLTAKIGVDQAKENIKKAIRNAVGPQLTSQAPEGLTFDDDETSLTFDNEGEEEKPSKVLKGGIFNLGKKKAAPDDTVYREELYKQTKSFEGENWNKVSKWLSDNFPNVPVYRVKNAIRATNGRQAWGMLHNGAIYLSNTSEVGTVYHEVFESIWKTFTDPIEQKAVLDEFKARKGSFTNKFTGKVAKYSEATEFDIKEQLAEEFRDYILDKKIPAKPTEGKPFIVRLFADIYNFFKSFFTGEKAQINTANLFSRIGNGYYKTFIPYESQLSFAKQGFIDIDSVQADNYSEFRMIKLPYDQVHEIIQQMTYTTLSEIIKNNKSLFGISKINKKELYSKLKSDFLSLTETNPGLISWKSQQYQTLFEEGRITEEEGNTQIAKLNVLYEAINDEWDELVKKHSEYLRNYSIQFDENDDVTVNDENNSGKEDYQDARKIDTFRKANPAIKLLLATLPSTQIVNDKPALKRSSIGGATLLPLDKVFITLKNKLYDSVDINEMMTRLRDFARNNPDYQALYNRLMKSPNEVDFTRLTNDYDIQLLSSFWKAMKAQNADTKIVFILPSGDVEVGDAHLSSVIRQAKYEMFNDVVSSLRSGSPYVQYDTKKKEFSATDKIKKLTLNPSKKESYIAFLEAIGVTFTKEELNKLTPNQYRTFTEATDGIKTSLSSISGIKDINAKTLDIEKRLRQLGSIKAILSNPEFESTYFNISGEKTQTYIGTNTVSDFYDVISKVNNLEELQDTRFKFILKDNFTKGSVVLKSIFTDSGDRKANTQDILKTGIVEGIVDETSGKRKESTQFTQKERFIQEINLNEQGWYMNLVPGDASIEWMINLHSKSNPLVSLQYGYEDLFDVFREYFISEILVSREGRKIANVKGRKSNDLRFFKGILDEKTHSKIVSNTTSSPETLYGENVKAINEGIKNLIKSKAKETRSNLEKYGIITYGEEGVEAKNLGFAADGITEESLDSNLEQMEANFIIANIELHKLIYSDPYFYKDELKRIKNFNSPGQPLLASLEVNEAIHKVYNKDYSKDDMGYTDFLVNSLTSVMTDDVRSTIGLKNYGTWEETDGGGIITMQANRNLRIRAANWNEREEEQYRYDIAFEKDKKNIELSKEEKDLLEKGDPQVKSAYTPLKPIVRGSKDDGSVYNDILLDKFALVPYSYKVLYKINPDSNAIKHYEKMIKEQVDYTVFSSGRKVGGGEASPIYNPDGTYITKDFKEVNGIPFSIINIQTEVPSKDKPQVTQGSQVTKLATMDFMDAGVPIDFEKGTFSSRFAKWIVLSESEKEKASPIYKEIKNNESLLNERINEGYKVLLRRLGISEIQDGYEINDLNRLGDTLKDEIFKREVNDNIISAFEGFKTGDVVLEATPAYQQIRNILYAIANKQVIRPTISGGMKVQVPSTLLESVRAKEEKGAYTSDILKFYEDEDGKRVCEIMVGRWFKSEKTDEELIKELNEYGVLGGIGFRIPTQKQNSIDVFRIKQFLPEEFGDSVIIPSALVKKVGSDFDIDKLSIYLKNTYNTLSGKTKEVPFSGYGQKSKDKLAQMYDEGNFLSEKDRAKANKWIKNRKIEDKDEVIDNLFTAIFGKQSYEDSYVQEVMDDLLDSKDDKEFKDKVVEEKYRQSLENEYIKSLEKLTSDPLNFERLITPNSADQLKGLSEQVVNATKQVKFDYTDVKNILDRNFMSSLRQAFVRGKYAIGIAATSQTNNAQNQRAFIHIDYSKLDTQPDDDKKWLGDGKIKFKEFNEINGKPTLSLSKNKDGQLISDIIGQFIDGYVDISKGPWIMQLGATPNTASTWLFLIKLGVPINTVAYFMNQPIVRDYLRELENAGYSWLFNDNIAKLTKSSYQGSNIVLTQIPSESALKTTMSKDTDSLTDKEKAEQLFILDEFFKYAKLAEHLFHVQQGSNFDTATISDPFITFKKEIQLQKARTTMISSVDDLLNNSFVGTIHKRINDIRNAFSTILISDKPNSVRGVMEQVLLPYVNNNDRDFVKISQKAVSDLFDWAVQTNSKINSRIKDILLGSDTQESATKQIMDFVNKVKKDKDHPLHNNFIVNSIKQTSDSVRENTPNNLYIVGKNNKVYDQNHIIYGFYELKKSLLPEEQHLYNKIIGVAVLQSGLAASKISFTHLLPYEDFKNIYNETLSILDKLPNLQQFKDINVFERNNWANDDIVPNKKAQLLKLKTPFVDFYTGYEKKYVYAPEREFLDNKLKKAVRENKIPETIQLSPYTKEGRSEFVVYSWEKTLSASYKKDKELKKEMRSKGDYSYIQKGLFQKVYGDNDLPLTTSYTNKAGKTTISNIFKAVNAWGDSYRANEFYNIPQQSVIDNGFIKVDEVPDVTIENVLYPPKVEKISKVKKDGTDILPNCI